MKPSTFKILSFVFSFTGAFAIFFLGLPLWTFFLFIPALVYTQLLVSNSYTFRQNLSIEPIPETGYEKRIHDLETSQPLLSELGFVKFDEFYLRLSNDSIAFAYQHQSLPIIALEYHFEHLKSIDFNTRFQDEISLTTTSLEQTQLLERSDKKLFQSFPELNFRQLFEKHIEAIEFMRAQGFEPVGKDLRNFRQKLLDNFREIGEKYKGFLSPFKVLYVYFSANKYEYRKTIQEQFLARSFKLPEQITEQKALPWRQ